MLDRYLYERLYRFDCPSPDVLRDYYWDHLPAEQRRQVMEHLPMCLHCTAELDSLAEAVATARAEPSSQLVDYIRQVAEQMQLVVARRVSPERGLAPAPRGEPYGVLLYNAEGVELSVNFEQEPTGGYTLFGQVLAPESAISPDSYVRLTSAEKGTPPVRATLDENGGFALAGLQPGDLQLVVSLPDRRILVPSLVLKADQPQDGRGTVSSPADRS